MKKLFKKLALAVVALLTFSVGSNYTVKEVKAADVITSVDFITKKVKHGAYGDSWKYDNWTVSGGANNNGGWNYVKMGGKNETLAKGIEVYIASPAVSKPSSKVTVNVIAGSLPKPGMSANIGLEVYSDSGMKKLIDSVALQKVSNSAKLFEFEPNNVSSWPSESYYKVVFECVNTSSTNGIVWLNNVSVYEDENAGDETPSPKITINEDAIDLFVDGVYGAESSTYSVKIENSELSNVEWNSSNPKIATVSQNGLVTAVSEGKTIISAILNGTNASDSIEITVHDKTNYSYVDNPKLNTPYVLGFEKTDTTYYFNGEMSGYYGATTTEIALGVKVKLEEADDGYYLSFTSSDLTSKYINVVKSVSEGKTYYNFTLDTVATSVFTFDKMYSAFVTDVEGSKFFIGGKKSYDTFSAYSYSNISNFDNYLAAHLYEVQENANIEAIKSKNTSFSLAFDYSLTYEKVEQSENTSKTVEIIASKLGYENGIAVEKIEQEGVTITFDKGTNSNAPKYYNTGSAIRTYGGNTFTVISESNISSVEFIFASGEDSNDIISNVGSFDTNKWTGEGKNIVFTISGTKGHRRISEIKVTLGTPAKEPELLDYSFANVAILFGASVDADLFEGYSVSGGVLIDNAAKYTDTTIAEVYENGEFEGVTTFKDSLIKTTDKDGNDVYSVGSVIEVINGEVNGDNKKYLEYEFIAAAYFTLTNENETITVVLQQKSYSVKEMVSYYNENASELEITGDTLSALQVFKNYIG